ncbi:MAG: rubredoxin-like domain-containing protein [Planctomycetota bacterium]
MEKKENLKWRCGKCGYTLTKPEAPETCPSCNEKCEFTNVTCYTPECGGPDNIDPQLYDRPGPDGVSPRQSEPKKKKK